jgi:hypothetical protein
MNDAPKDDADVTTKKSQRTGGYTAKEAKCHCQARLQLGKIQFALPRTKEGRIGGRLPNSSITVGNSSPTKFIVIEAKYHFKIHGHSSKRSAINFVLHMSMC